MAEDTQLLSKTDLEDEERGMTEIKQKKEEVESAETEVKSRLQQREEEDKIDAARAEVRDEESSENDIKALQSVGQIVGEVLKQFSEEKFIVNVINGPCYVVGCGRSINKEALKQGTWVVLDMTASTIMRQLPREVDPLVYKMSHEDPSNNSYVEIAEEIRKLREDVGLLKENLKQEFIKSKKFAIGQFC